MASTNITFFPSDYKYVLAVAAVSTTVNIYHMLLTSRRRKAAKVKYPLAYAPTEEAEKDEYKAAFNCAQKAHSNFGENYPVFLTTLAISGLEHPQVASGLGAAWIVGRFLYAYGYARVGRQYSENGKGRLIGAWASLPLLGLTGTSIWTTVSKLL